MCQDTAQSQLNIYYPPCPTIVTPDVCVSLIHIDKPVWAASGIVTVDQLDPEAIAGPWPALVQRHA
jgi:hypothetical protein